jgi:hypothetical protein
MIVNMKYTLLFLASIILFTQGCGVKPKQVIHSKETSFPQQYPAPQ